MRIQTFGAIYKFYTFQDMDSITSPFEDILQNCKNCNKDQITTQYIQSFTQAIHSKVSLQVHYYTEALPTQHGYCVRVSRRSATGNSTWRTCLPKVPTWRLEQDSYLQPVGRNAPNLPRPTRVVVAHTHFTLVLWNSELYSDRMPNNIITYLLN